MCLVACVYKDEEFIVWFLCPSHILVHVHIVCLYCILNITSLIFKMVGALNVHVWQAWCGSTIHDLRRNRFFPLYPDIRLTVKKFFLRHMQADYGQRIFGYVHPPVSGIKRLCKYQ